MRVTTTLEWELDPPADSDGDYRKVTLEITFDFVRGCKEAAPTYFHGGLPAEPDEIDIVDVWIVAGPNDTTPVAGFDLEQITKSEKLREKLIEAALDQGAR